MTRSGSTVSCPICDRRLSSYGLAGHRRACRRRLRVAGALVAWGIVLGGGNASRIHVFNAAGRIVAEYLGKQ